MSKSTFGHELLLGNYPTSKYNLLSLLSSTKDMLSLQTQGGLGKAGVILHHGSTAVKNVASSHNVPS